MVRSLKIGLFFDWFGKSDEAAASCNNENIDPESLCCFSLQQRSPNPRNGYVYSFNIPSQIFPFANVGFDLVVTLIR